jgi:hypothetical protein
MNWTHSVARSERASEFRRKRDNIRGLREGEGIRVRHREETYDGSLARFDIHRPGRSAMSGEGYESEVGYCSYRDSRAMLHVV